MPRTPTPLESFGPDLMAALLAGAKGKFEIKLPYRTAVKFRQRVYQLRNIMRKSDHDAAAAVSRTRITISWPPNTPEVVSSKKVKWPKDLQTPCIVTIAPYDSEFGPALAAAGIKAQDLTDDPLDSLIPSAEPFKNFVPSKE